MKVEQEMMEEYTRKMAGQIGRLQEQLTKRDAALRVRDIATPGTEAEDDDPPKHKVRRKRVPSAGAEAGLPSPPPSASSCSEPERRSSLDSHSASSRPSYSPQKSDDFRQWSLVPQTDDDDEKDALLDLSCPPSPLLTPTTSTPPSSSPPYAQDQDDSSIIDKHDYEYDHGSIVSVMAMRDGRSSRLGHRNL